MGSAGNVPERQRRCPAAHREWQVAGMERPQGRALPAQEVLVLEFSGGKPFQDGETRSTLPRFQQAHPQSSPDHHEVGKKRKWQRRGTGRPSREKVGRDLEPGKLVRVTPENKGDFSRLRHHGNVNRHASKEGSDRNAGSHQFQYSKLTDRSCFLGPHPPVCLLPYYWGAGPGQPGQPTGDI